MSWKWRHWYQNEVDEEIKGVDSRDDVKRTERSDQLFLEDYGGRARVTTDEEEDYGLQSRNSFPISGLRNADTEIEC